MYICTHICSYVPQDSILPCQGHTVLQNLWILRAFILANCMKNLDYGSWAKDFTSQIHNLRILESKSKELFG